MYDTTLCHRFDPCSRPLLTEIVVSDFMGLY